MRNRVDSGAGGDARRLGNRERRIENRYPRGRLRIAAGHFLVRVFVGNQGEGLALAAGARRGGNRNHRQHRSLRFAGTPVILHPPAICQQKVAALCRIHAAPTTQADDRVDAGGSRHAKAIFDAAGSGVLNDLFKHDHAQTRGLQKVFDSMGVAGGDDARVGYDQDALRR